MPTDMDRHDLPEITAEALAAAHVLDLGKQGAYGVRFLTYWLDSPRGFVFCLADAPDAEAVVSVHRDAHGEIPNRVFEVDPHAVTSFLGAIVEPEPGTPWAASAFRTIMFTDLVGSTSFISTLGDVAAKNLVLDVDAVVRTELAKHGGTAVDHTGDGVMASFPSPRDAVPGRDRHPACGRVPGASRPTGPGPRRARRRRTHHGGRPALRRRGQPRLSDLRHVRGGHDLGRLGRPRARPRQGVHLRRSR